MYKRQVLIGTPSYALRLAEVAQDMGLDPATDLNLRVGCFGGEGSTEAMRAKINEAFGLFATENYGMSELIGPGVSGECHELTGMHINEAVPYTHLDVYKRQAHYEWWVEKIQKAHITLPVDVGIMPVLAKDPTIRMAVSNGSSIPRDLAEIIARYGDNPEDFKKAGMEYTVKQIHRFISAGIDGLHIYSLNKWADISEIVRAAGIR